MKVAQLLDLGTLVAPRVQGHGLPLPQELWPYRSLSSSLLWLVIRRLLWPVFLRGSTHSGTWRAPLPGVLLCCLARQALKEAPLVGSYSVVQCVSLLIGPPLYFSAADSGVWGVRGYGYGSNPIV